MKITNALIREHRVFYEQLDALERALSASRLPEAMDLVAELGASLEAHAGLEDGLLFAALEPLIGSAGPLSLMRMEHGEIENTLAQLADKPDSAKFEALGWHLLEVARSHFAKEEMVLFPLSDQVLDQAALEELGGQLETRPRGIMI